MCIKVITSQRWDVFWDTVYKEEMTDPGSRGQRLRKRRWRRDGVDDGGGLQSFERVQVEEVSEMCAFVKYLTSEMHRRVTQSEVIWFDSVTCDGELKWQDELNEHNRWCTFSLCLFLAWWKISRAGLRSLRVLDTAVLGPLPMLS